MVVATGGYQAHGSRRSPPSSIRASCSSTRREYRNPAQLREGSVLVVGAGNSGAEIALEVVSAHPTWLSGRERQRARPRREPVGPAVHAAVLVRALARADRADADRPQGPADCPTGAPARAGQAEGSRRGRGRAGAARTVGVRDGLPVLEDGRALDVANVIWCTGFVPDFSWIDLPVSTRTANRRTSAASSDRSPGSTSSACSSCLRSRRR